MRRPRRINKEKSRVENTFMEEADIRSWFEGSSDIVFVRHKVGSSSHRVMMTLFYCDNLIDKESLRKTVLPYLNKLNVDKLKYLEGLGEGMLTPIQKLEPPKLREQIIEKVFEGQLLVFLVKPRVVYAIDLSAKPQRSVDQSNSEVSIKGPRDGFIEEIDTNLGLIRKRLKTNTLTYKEFVIGKRTLTKVRLLYVEDIASSTMIQDVEKRLSEIQMDGIVSSSQIEEMITDYQYSLFPLVEYTGRPDYATHCLLNGRFIILVEGSPTVIIGPVSLPFFINNAEDNHTLFYFASFGRILRHIGLIIATFLPGFWIALVSYHPDQLPYTLLATLTLSREGVPLPTPLEGLMVIVLFDLIREAGLRLPAAIGQTLSVVGGLIIGQAAISAGFASPGILVVMATSVVSTFILSNLSLTGTVSILRYVVYIFSSILGVVGFILCLLSIGTYVVRLQSFGLPYLSPYSPPVGKSIWPSFVRRKYRHMKSRPVEINPIDPTKQGD